MAKYMQERFGAASGYDAQRAEADRLGNSSRSMGIAGSAAVSIQSAMVKNVPTMQPDEVLAELMAKAPVSLKSMVRIMPDGEPWCELCGKKGFAHLVTAAHSPSGGTQHR